MSARSTSCNSFANKQLQMRPLGTAVCQSHGRLPKSLPLRASVTSGSQVSPQGLTAASQSYPFQSPGTHSTIPPSPPLSGASPGAGGTAVRSTGAASCRGSVPVAAGTHPRCLGAGRGGPGGCAHGAAGPASASRLGSTADSARPRAAPHTGAGPVRPGSPGTARHSPARRPPRHGHGGGCAAGTPGGAPPGRAAAELPRPALPRLGAAGTGVRPGGALLRGDSVGLGSVGSGAPWAQKGR